MINEASLAAVKGAFQGRLCACPLYADYCFSNIPSAIASYFDDSVRSLLPSLCLPATEHRVERVVSIFVDAMGWQSISEMDHPFLTRCAEEGIVSKLTSQFPSTTAAHVTSFSTGLPVGQNGVYEWWQYQPELNDLIRPIMFSSRDAQDRRDDLDSFRLRPQDVFPNQSWLRNLRMQGVRITTLMPQGIVGSLTNRYLMRNTRRIGTSDFAEGARIATELEWTSRQIVHIYVDALDAAGHKAGPDSAAYRETRNDILDTIERLYVERADGRTLFLVFADHGQISVAPKDPARNVVLDVEASFLENMLHRSSRGDVLPPAGGMRDVFLHVQEPALDQCVEQLSSLLGERAVVTKTDHLIRNGLFGPAVSDEFRRRVGNVTILPAPGLSLTWSSHAPNRLGFLGDHGGLTREEMEIPFLALV
ncbi:MAG: alkaline phosphatase family protein [Bdellovibrionota bacterium]